MKQNMAVAWVIAFYFSSVCFADDVLLAKDSSKNTSTYKAAVLEHEPVPSIGHPIETMMANLQVYAKNAALASQQGAKIIVFPEYGITGVGISKSGRPGFYDYLQYVPDPTKVKWNPCSEPNKFDEKTEIIETLSCIANSSAIVVVANLLTRVSCENTSNPSCPHDGQFIFNTNVIFGTNGEILGRYHKRHLFEEKDIDSAETPEFVIVDLGFTRLATFICSDIMYLDPAVQLVTEYGIKNIAFSTAWVNELPFLTSVQTFSAFARGLEINFIAANLHKPENGNLGSGIYSSANGALNQTYDLAASDRLIISELSIDPSSRDDLIPASTVNCSTKEMPHSRPQEHFVSTKIDEPSSAHVNASHLIWYQILTNSKYTFLDQKRHYVSVCQKQICCYLDYKMMKPSREMSYALVAFSDYHGKDYQRYYLEICALLRCETKNIERCGQFSKGTKSSGFQRLTLTGKFTTNYLFPSILSTRLNLVPSYFWKFSKSSSSTNCSVTSKISLTSPVKMKILSAQIVGRVYDWDLSENEV